MVKILKLLPSVIFAIIFWHLLLGLVGLDLGTYEVIEFIFGTDRALDIWWSEWFDSTYFVSHILVLSVLIIIIKLKEE